VAEEKPDLTTELRGIENSDTEYNLVAQGNLAEPSRRPPLQRAGLMHRSLLRRANVGYGGPRAAYDRRMGRISDFRSLRVPDCSESGNLFFRPERNCL